MYISERPQSHPIDLYSKDESSSSLPNPTTPPPPPPPSHMILQLPNPNPSPNSTLLTPSADDSDLLKAPKKRAETWAQDETRCLISLRREMDSLFNTSKSNKHLWEKISLKMREKGYDRSPTMCTDKWRNLLKEFKKAKYQERERELGGGSITATTTNNNSSRVMSCYKEIEQILRERSRRGQFRSSDGTNTSVANANVNPKGDDAYMHFSEKGIEDPGISYGPADGSCRPAPNLERQLDHDGHPLAIMVTDADAINGVPPWNWRETSGNGAANQSYGGRVISVKWGDYTRRIGIDGTADSIKEAIRSAFRLRTKRAFWLEDEDQIVRSLDKDMPLGNYTLHLDEGLAIKVVCLYDETDQIPVHTDDEVFYTEDDYHEFLTRRGWISLREFDGYRNVDNMDDLRPGVMYRGVS